MLYTPVKKDQQQTIVDEVDTSGAEEGTEVLCEPVDGHFDPLQTTDDCQCQRHCRIYVTTCTRRDFWWKREKLVIVAISLNLLTESLLDGWTGNSNDGFVYILTFIGFFNRMHYI